MARLFPLLIVAALLRLLRTLVRWDEVAWLYAAYSADTSAALEEGRLLDALTGWTGLHPPLFSLIHAGTEWLAPAPLLWLATSAAASLLAVFVVARRDEGAGWLLATAPIQLTYAAEVNDYPLLELAVALLWALRRPVAEGRSSALGLGLVGVIAAWTHPLGGLVAGGVALSLPAGPRGVALSLMGLGALPLAPTVLRQLADPSGTRQPPFKAALVVGSYLDRFGALGLLGLPLLVFGAAPRRAELLGGVGMLLVIGVLVALGFAAPHQFPYFVCVGAPLALVMSAGARGRWRLLLAGLVLAQGLWFGGFDALRLRALWLDPPRAVDRALGELQQRWSCTDLPSPSCAGDALYLLAPAGLDDDDKGRSSAVLWRLRPWWSMPMVRPYLFRYADFRHGQPRLVRGYATYVNDNLRPELELAVAAHPRLWLVVYEHGERAELTTKLAARLRVEPERIGGDLLFRLGSTAPSPSPSPAP